MHFELEDMDQQAKIKVVGVGGGGGNAVANMIAESIEGVDFIIANTDVQAIDANPAQTKIQIGSNLSKGLGAGGMPDVGRKAALEDVNAIAESLAGSDMVFIAAGMGGGTGTGAAPIVAQVARDAGALTVGVVTKPFRFEGKKRGRLAEEGLLTLNDEVDTLITIPNDRLLTLDENLTMKDAFRCADKVLSNAVRGISDLITIRGDINVDFADVRTIMGNRGRALMGTGYGKGDKRAVDAAEMAINSPLLEDVSIEGAMGILINVTGGPDLTMREVSDAVEMIEEAAHEDCHIIFGYVTLDEPCEEVKVTVIATGFQATEMAAMPSRSVGTPKRNAGSLYSQAPRAAEQAPRVAANHAPRIASTPRVSEAGEPVHVNSGRASMVRNEAELDIPAFIRRSSES